MVGVIGPANLVKTILDEFSSCFHCRPAPAVICFTGIKIDVGYGAASNVAVAEEFAKKALEMSSLDDGGTAYLIDGEMILSIGNDPCSSVFLFNAGGSHRSTARALPSPFSPGTFMRRQPSNLLFSTEFSDLLAGRKIISTLSNLEVIQPCAKRQNSRRGRPETPGSGLPGKAPGDHPEGR